MPIIARTPEQIEPFIQPLKELTWTKRTGAARRKFEGQRRAVELRHQLL